MVIPAGKTAAITGTVTSNSGILNVNSNLGTAAARIASLTVGDSNIGGNPARSAAQVKCSSLRMRSLAALRSCAMARFVRAIVLDIDNRRRATVDAAMVKYPAAIVEVELDPASNIGSQIVVSGGLDLNQGSLNVILDSAPTLSQRFDIISSDLPTATTFVQGATVDAVYGSFVYRFGIDYLGNATSPGLWV